MRLRDCHNFNDFRELARRRLPGPIFDYIAGGADDEATLRQNTASFEHCDLVPNVLRGVEALDISVKVMGQKLAMPVYCSPTALQGRRRAIDRHCKLLAHHFDGNIESFHAAENVRHQIAMFKACGILTKCRLVVCSARDVIKDRTRQASPCQFAKIIKIVAVAQSHSFTPPRRVAPATASSARATTPV